MNSKVSLKTPKGNLGYYCENAAFHERQPLMQAKKQSVSPMKDMKALKEISIIQQSNDYVHENRKMDNKFNNYMV